MKWGKRRHRTHFPRHLTNDEYSRGGNVVGNIAGGCSYLLAGVMIGSGGEILGVGL
jgi:hypothetical protein